MSQWIDFRELRSKLRFAAVLSHYKVAFKTRGDQAGSSCPLPTHQGDRKAESFSANLKRGVWRCFGCGTHGNILDFAVRMEELSTESSADIRAVALRLDKVFNLGCAKMRSPRSTQAQSGCVAPLLPGPQPAEHKHAGAVINPPLDFRLKDLDAGHSWFQDHGIAPQTAMYFGAGYCTRGYFAGRITIPLHNAHGQLVGYVGRILSDVRVNAKQPKYLYPVDRVRDGVPIQFDRSLLVYNIHRLRLPLRTLLVVEDYESVWWLHQAGFPNTISFLGLDYTAVQAQDSSVGIDPSTRIVIVPAGTREGEAFAERVFQMLGANRWVRRVELPDDKRPIDVMPHELIARLPT